MREEVEMENFPSDGGFTDTFHGSGLVNSPTHFFPCLFAMLPVPNKGPFGSDNLGL